MFETSKVVLLPFAKAQRQPLELHYTVRATTGVQARFAGRVVAIPQLGLKQYVTRAVIDWIVLSVKLRRPTQFRYVQDAIVRAGLRKPFAWARIRDESNSTQDFQIKVQDATPQRVAAHLAALRAEFGLDTEPGIEAMEISVDFWPKDLCETSRMAMVGVLGRHLFPMRDFTTFGVDRPRFSAAPGHSEYLVGDRRSSASLDRLRHVGADRTWPIDATLMIGRRHGPAQWKVMDKLLDCQHPDGSRLELVVQDRRARIEVTLDRTELGQLGLHQMSDLSAFSCTRLQGRYFRFMLPTFARPVGRLAAVAAHFERQRMRRFTSAGVVGLLLMDKATAEFHSRNASWVRRDLRVRRLPIRRTSTGRGTDGSFVSYGELNDRVSGALEKLGMRWKEIGPS